MLGKAKKAGEKKILIVSIAIIIVLFLFSGKIGSLNEKTSFLIYPVQAKIYFLSEKISEMYNATINYSKILEKNEELRKRNLFLTLDKYKYNQVLEENERLKTLLEIKKNDYNIKIGTLSFRSVSDLYKNFSINLGSEDGIIEDMVAISGNNLVGKVSEVYTSHSKVEMITNSKVFISATTTNGVMGIVRGDDNYPNRLTFSPSVIQGDVKVGDEIQTSGISDIYPKELTIGKVISVGDTESEFIIQPKIDLLKLQEVILISREVN
ncbi:MAG: rod shape-determining protein MreC [Fusobacteriaceae bacterium]